MRRIDLEEPVPAGTHAKSLCQAYAWHAILEVGSLKREVAVAIENFLYACHAGKIVVHAHDVDHGLLTAIEGEGLVLHTLGNHVDLWQLTDLHEHGIVGRRHLALHGNDLELRVKVGEERSDQVMEAVEHAEHDDQSHRSHRHTHHRDDGYDVYGVGALLREQVTSGYEERKVEPHFFSSESMCSI